MSRETELSCYQLGTMGKKSDYSLNSGVIWELEVRSCSNLYCMTELFGITEEVGLCTPTTLFPRTVKSALIAKD